MGLIRRLADWLEPREKRQADTTWRALSVSAGPNTVDPVAAETLATAFAAIQGISSAISSLPAYVYRSTDGGREEDPGHSVSRLIRDGFTPHMSWSDGIEFLISQCLTRGNGLCEIERDSSGRVTGLIPIPYNQVAISLLPSGRLAYDVTHYSDFGSSGRTKRLLDEEVLHIKDRSDDGYVGRSRLVRAMEALRSALTVNESAQLGLQDGPRMRGYWTTDEQLSDEALQSLFDSLNRVSSGENQYKSPLLDHGLKWNATGMSFSDAQMVELKRFAAEELARIFQVPPPLVGIWDNSSFTNSETAGRWFAQHTLQPWVTKLESEFRRQVFSASSRTTHHLEIDMSAFLRGDPAARWQAWDIAIRNGILTADEIREVEGWNPQRET